ncbi:hypothetical protein MXB_5201 [Myxobolus squamalis]|nr:hypothetical protein MXB_5201 [Myxobolus squamalis]
MYSADENFGGGGSCCKWVHLCKLLVVDAVVDVKSFISQFLISEAKDLQKYPSLIYQSLLDAAHGNFLIGVFRLLSRKTLLEQIQQLWGNNATIENIDSPLFSLTSQSFPFLWRNASNEGLVVLRMESSVFLDVTFRVTPVPFLQCMIIMGFDPN